MRCLIFREKKSLRSFVGVGKKYGCETFLCQTWIFRGRKETVGRGDDGVYCGAEAERAMDVVNIEESKEG